MSEYIEIYLKNKKIENELTKKIENSRKINSFKKELNLLKEKEKKLNDNLIKEENKIKDHLLQKNKLKVEDFRIPFFEDFGLFMGEKIKITPKFKKIEKYFLINPFKKHISTAQIDNFKQNNIDIYNDLISNKSLSIGHFNKYDLDIKEKERLSYIIKDFLYFMLFYNKNSENIYVLNKMCDAVFGNPAIYI
jgi:hypothetical protein